jgi:hypothetical protein
MYSHKDVFIFEMRQRYILFQLNGAGSEDFDCSLSLGKTRTLINSHCRCNLEDNELCEDALKLSQEGSSNRKGNNRSYSNVIR